MPQQKRGFYKGMPKVPGSGRRKGSVNRHPQELRQILGKVVNDPAYLAKLAARMKRGKIAPQVEVMIWHYAIGKPREELAIEMRGPDVSALSDAQLRERLTLALSGLATQRALPDVTVEAID